MNLLSLLTSYAEEGIGIIVLIFTVVQIAPIEINPWSAIAKLIGGAINKEVLDKVDQVSDELKNLRQVCDEREANSCRSNILHFNDEVLHGVRHTKEHYDQMLIDINNYELYCAKHQDYKNNVANLAIDNIKRTYKICVEKTSFL